MARFNAAKDALVIEAARRTAAGERGVYARLAALHGDTAKQWADRAAGLRRRKGPAVRWTEDEDRMVRQAIEESRGLMPSGNVPRDTWPPIAERLGRSVETIRVRATLLRRSIPAALTQEAGQRPMSSS